MNFMGYIRPNGRVGIRNHVIAIANCSCANGIINRIAEKVPGIIPMIHTYGCSIPGEFDAGAGSLSVSAATRTYTVLSSSASAVRPTTQRKSGK